MNTPKIDVKKLKKLHDQWDKNLQNAQDFSKIGIPVKGLLVLPKPILPTSDILMTAEMTHSDMAQFWPEYPEQGLVVAMSEEAKAADVSGKLKPWSKIYIRQDRLRDAFYYKGTVMFQITIADIIAVIQE